MKRPIILALDTKEISIAEQWIDATRDLIDIYKVGLEFFLKHGAEGVNSLRAGRNLEIFLDLKLHDIPNTVAGAVQSVSDIHPRFLTVHASGGAAMISAAAAVNSSISITAVTILTSLSDSEVSEIGYRDDAHASALRLAEIAAKNGAGSIVCSPFEVAAIRRAVGDSMSLITPGVRPLGADIGDQFRVMTPQQAIAAGADYLVIGRPITGEWKNGAAAMKAAAQTILDSVN